MKEKRDLVMATVTFKNNPEDLYEKLKQAASAHHRSVNSELIYCLEKTFKPTRISALVQGYLLN